MLEQHVKERRAFRDGAPRQRARRAQRHAAPPHPPISKRQSNEYAPDLLNQLADRRGHHVPLPLQEAPERAHHAHKEQTGGNRHVARLGFLGALPGRQPAGEQQHQQHGQQAQHQQHPHGHGENAPGVARVFPGDVVRHHAGNRHRQSRGGNGEQQVIGGIHLVVHAHAIRPDQMGQRDAVQHAHHLADDARDAQDGYPAHQGFLFLGHKGSFGILIKFVRHESNQAHPVSGDD